MVLTGCLHGTYKVLALYLHDIFWYLLGNYMVLTLFPHASYIIPTEFLWGTWCGKLMFLWVVGIYVLLLWSVITCFNGTVICKNRVSTQKVPFEYLIPSARIPQNAQWVTYCKRKHYYHKGCSLIYHKTLTIYVNQLILTQRKASSL